MNVGPLIIIIIILKVTQVVKKASRLRNKNSLTGFKSYRSLVPLLSQMNLLRTFIYIYTYIYFIPLGSILLHMYYKYIKQVY
jgi:hypothetical protein